MIDRRAVLGVAAGLLGLALGAAAAVWEVVQLAVVAGALALVAGVSVLRLVQLLRSANNQITELSTKVDELSGVAEREAKARAEAEADRDAEFADRTNRTAVREDGGRSALTDPVSGLFSNEYFHVALDARVSAARRHLRPVAVVLIEVIDSLGSSDTRRADPLLVAETVKATLREADTPCRLEGGSFGLLLEDTPENGAIWTVERLRRTLSDKAPDLTLWAGISCYPAHGFSGDDLLDAAEHALAQAREWRQDRIEVAATDG